LATAWSGEATGATAAAAAAFSKSWLMTLQPPVLLPLVSLHLKHELLPTSRI